MRLMSNSEGDDVRGLFFFFFKSCSNASRQWWLSNIGSSRGADEEFSLSSLTQGYGSILLSTLFLFHHKLLPLSLYSTSVLSQTLVAVIRLGLLGDNDPVFLCLNFCLSFAFPALSHNVFPLSFSRSQSFHYSRLFCHAPFSLFHTIFTIMKHSGRSCKCWIPGHMLTRKCWDFFSFFGHLGAANKL